jgi:osmoprotectant transport system ATP-binding protein
MGTEMTIELQSVSKQYADGTLAVDAVSLSARSHQTLALVGSSGSGKTTLLRMINRMIKPDSGRVLIDGTDVGGLDPVALRRSIGYVMQDGGLMPHRTIINNVATVPLLNGVRRNIAYAQAVDLLRQVGLDPGIAQRYPAELSGGQQQRVGVARALAANPYILLMDEPFAAVDPIVRRELQDQLLKLQNDLGKTIVFVTHDIDEAFYLADRVALLRPGGRLVQEGTPEELIDNPIDTFVTDFINAGRPRSGLQ